MIVKFGIDARVTKTLLYGYDIRMVMHHFILHVGKIKSKSWNV